MGPSGPGSPPAPPAAPPRLPGPPSRPEARPPVRPPARLWPARPTRFCDTQSAWPSPGQPASDARAPGGFAGDAEQGRLRKGLGADAGAAGGTRGTPAPPPVPASRTPPSVRVPPLTVAPGRGDRTRGTAFGTSELSKAGTQGEQTPTELVHPNCLVVQGPGPPPAETVLSTPPCPHLGASSLCWPLTVPSRVSSPHDASCLVPSTQSHRGHRGNRFLRLRLRALVFPNSNLLSPASDSQPGGGRSQEGTDDRAAPDGNRSCSSHSPPPSAFPWAGAEHSRKNKKSTLI